MGIGPVGNAIYVNQQTASVSSEHTARNNRIEMQNFAAGVAISKEEKEVKEVRPAEENHKVDADREHQRQEHDEEQKRSPKRENIDKKDDENEDGEIHHLDIKV
ncbi:hypothetical protein KKA17_03665 [bacterium]|nr:hypothetical protein [bacterium]MBU1883936.1 hypothetical protein [bacterium]